MKYFVVSPSSWPGIELIRFLKERSEKKTEKDGKETRTNSIVDELYYH